MEEANQGSQEDQKPNDQSKEEEKVENQGTQDPQDTQSTQDTPQNTESTPQSTRPTPAEEPMRVRLPRGKEVIGEIIELLGASRFRVSCQDGNTRICRMPGRFRRRMRIRVGDLVLIEPWDIEFNDKGDVVWIYTRTQASWLRRKGRFK